MKNETKMAVLRFLATSKTPEYERLKKRSFTEKDIKWVGEEIAAELAEKGMTVKSIARLFSISKMRAKRQIFEGGLYKFDELDDGANVMLAILSKYYKDAWIYDDLLKSNISDDDISNVLSISKDDMYDMVNDYHQL